MSPYRFCVRDLVCLRLASGELTEEGRALEAWSGANTDLARTPLTRWGERAGILFARDEWLRIDRRRLAMALGREDVAGVDWGTNPPTVAVAQRPASPPQPPAPKRTCESCRHEAGFLHDGIGPECGDCLRRRRIGTDPTTEEYAPRWEPIGDRGQAKEALSPAPVMCSRCRVQPATSKVRGIATAFCSDCAQIVDDEFHRESVSHGDDDDAKYSGEQHLDALRDWLRRPMGTR